MVTGGIRMNEYIYAKEMVLRLFLSYMEIGKDLGVLRDLVSVN